MTLPQIFSAARVGLHSWEPKAHVEPIVDIARGLIAIRQAGLLRAVYIDAGIIRIVYGKAQHQRSITHDEAAKIVKTYRSLFGDAQ